MPTMAIAIIMAIPTATMYVIRSVVVARFDGAVVGAAVGAAVGAGPTNRSAAALELP